MPDRGVPIGDPINTAGHVATPEWQSFEQRMRRRRADRCVRRAEEALGCGRFDEASEALEEARSLDPLHEGLQNLFDRLTDPRTTATIDQPVTVVAAAPIEHIEAVESHTGSTAPIRVTAPALDTESAVRAPAPSFLKPASSFAKKAERGAPDARPLAFDELAVLGALPPPPEDILPERRRSSAWRVAAVACLALTASAFAGWFAWTQWPMVLRSDTAADVRLPLEIPPALRFGSQESPAVPEPEPIAVDPSTTIAGTSGADEPETAPTESVVDRVPEADRVADAAPAAVRAEEREPAAAVAPAIGNAASVPPAIREPLPSPRPETATLPAQPQPDAPRPSTGNETRAALGPAPPPVPVEDARSSVPPLASVTALPAPSSPPAPEDVRPAPAEPRPSATVVDERAAVRAILSRYESAYSRLDAAGAAAVWPGVDRRALARAFDGLDSQRVTLDSCDVGVTGSTARARCAGSATWTPKVGGGTRTQVRSWTFDLRRADGGWQIVKVDTR